MMKDLIFISAYCPTEEHENNLDRCINSVLECGKHIVLVSHSHIPIHIQKKCQYYIYDYNNDISEDHSLFGSQSFYFDNKRRRSFFLIRHFMDLQFIGCFQLLVKLQ